jgi:predicted nucleic acid-binding protein
MLFDASSIYLLAKDGRIELLMGESTLSLAIYELGNAILKDVRVFKSISPEEGMKAVSFLRRVLERMDIRAIDGHEDRILKLAEERRLSFYDAAYLQMALELGAPLVTEDEVLKRVADSLTDVCSAHEL